MRIFGILLALATVADSTRPAGGADNASLFNTDATVNLATLRGVSVSASNNLGKGEPDSILHPRQGEIRFRSDNGPCYWMMEFRTPEAVAQVRLHFRDVINSIHFDVKVSRKPMSETNWSSQKPISTFEGVAPKKGTRRIAECNFKPKTVRSLRIEIYGHNRPEFGSQKISHRDLVISKLQVSGNRKLPITPRLSIAQHWAGGTCTVIDPVRGTQNGWPFIDENRPDLPSFGEDHVRFYAPGSGQGTAPTKPCNFVVTLKDRSRVEAVGYSAIDRGRPDRPRDLKVYTSPADVGDEWQLQRELRNILGGEYEEIEFPSPAEAKRVRFEVSRVWNEKTDPKHNYSFGHLGELFVYGSPVAPDFSFALKRPALTTASIHDSEGRRIRTLWSLKQLDSGTHGGSWDGLDDLGNALPAGDYEYRVLVNQARHKNVSVLGNNAVPNNKDNHNPAGLLSLAVDDEGHVYSANDWAEAGQDFRKWHRVDGRRLLDAKFQIRNGKPEGGAHAIAVDKDFIYCVVHAWPKEGREPQLIQRFRKQDGKLEGFTQRNSSGGHILLHEAPKSNVPPGTADRDRGLLGTNPNRAIVVVDDLLYVADAFGSIRRFDKVTGESRGNIEITLPHALALGPRGNLWVGHEQNRITVVSADGNDRWPIITDLGHIRSLTFGPEHRLYVADQDAGQIKIFDVDLPSRTLRPVRLIGDTAQVGDYAPDRFAKLLGLAVDHDGNVYTSQQYPTGGARLTKFLADGSVAWDQFSLEYCSTGNYSIGRPNELISQEFNRYELIDKNRGLWEFRGNVLASDPRYQVFKHGTTNLLKGKQHEFLLQSYGDGLQVYRRVGDKYQLASMIGSREPYPNGEFFHKLPPDRRPPAGVWSWNDANGNAEVDDDEINWFRKPGESHSWAGLGFNTDRRGNAIYCEPGKNRILEIPVQGTDSFGNPIYDLSARRELRTDEAIKSSLLTGPLMAKRADDGTFYAVGRSKEIPKPQEAILGWMAGWVVARYDAEGNELWSLPLPEACPGMDVIPSGESGQSGVMLSSVKRSAVFHITSEGQLVNVMTPGVIAGNDAGCSDNTGSLQINRDPRDGYLDVFVEDCLFHRFLWYRVDDRRPPAIARGALRRE